MSRPKKMLEVAAADDGPAAHQCPACGDFHNRPREVAHLTVSLSPEDSGAPDVVGWRQRCECGCVFFSRTVWVERWPQSLGEVGDGGSGSAAAVTRHNQPSPAEPASHPWGIPRKGEQ